MSSDIIYTSKSFVLCEEKRKERVTSLRAERGVLVEDKSSRNTFLNVQYLIFTTFNKLQWKVLGCSKLF